ncbi:putative 2-oxoglutarate-dependent dioxygenase [Hyphodiscus hymeniophilus]|uniref:2-oxoglutarate-dependent dioxygenase n=1 Tax=Hyphodiscus hymeniophilus TaxID=353542 RepID=A0A9P6VK88_9HELO|nr:putative 2-oxoglutarate-dependent dioxygenase [Hyphodiscus hymeniophilus]
MSTSFSSLPIVSLSTLSSSSSSLDALEALSLRLDEVFSTTGFAYLTDLPLTYSHDDVFGLCDDFFGHNGLSEESKMKLAKKSFVKNNKNTYRGYFPPQAGADNLKEGFEIGSPSTRSEVRLDTVKFNLTEPNVFPSSNSSFRTRCETLHAELQTLSAKLLSVLATSLGKLPSFFEHYLEDSLSTLRLLHYPPVPAERQQDLICTPHTDSGILTLLHQDKTGGLEVRNSDGEWIPAPYVPGSMVVNIGDLMAKVSEGRWIATYHRVRSMNREGGVRSQGRYSIPFFFEPGMDCVVQSVEGRECVYGEHVLEKMKGWVEFQDVVKVPEESAGRIAVEAF